MRKIFFVFVAVLWAVAGIQLVQNLNPEDETQIVQAFNKTNCMNAMSRIQVSGSLAKGYQTLSEQENTLKEIAAAIGITGDYQLSEERDGARSTLILCKQAAKAETVMKIVTVEDEISDNIVESIQYLAVEIELYDRLECAVSYKENLEEIVKEYGITEDVSLQFSGVLPGNISADECSSMTSQLLRSISAKIQTKHEEENLYTVYAYSDRIEDFKTINGHKVNVMVAINYDEENNQTGLYLATPFLNQDY